MAKIRPPKIPVRPPDKVAMLTSALRTYMAQNDSHDVHVLAEIGRRLAEIRDELRHGQWNAWLDREVPFTSRSATNSIQVHHFQTAQPDLFERVAPLGRSKLYLLMNLPPARLRFLLDAPAHPLPSGAAKPLDRLSTPELKHVLKNKSNEPPDPGAELEAKLRRDARALIRTINLVAKNRALFDPDDLEDIHDALLAALEKLLGPRER